MAMVNCRYRASTPSPLMACRPSTEPRSTASAHIEEGYLQAERGDLIDGAQARREIQRMKDNWREGRSPKR
jgi:3-deoxy-D-arabino-heptulosonate 7-phosphate (DAHP) synthase class II